MDREAILRFAGEFDRLPFHLDEAAAGESIFGGLIASGLHTLSVAAGIVVDEYFVDTTMTGGAGISELRWLCPVRPGDTIGVALTIVDTERLAKRPELGRVRIVLDVANQAGQRVMTAHVDYLFRCRAAAQATLTVV